MHSLTGDLCRKTRYSLRKIFVPNSEDKQFPHKSQRSRSECGLLPPTSATRKSQPNNSLIANSPHSSLKNQQPILLTERALVLYHWFLLFPRIARDAGFSR
jgi:hypothetical protein